MSLYEQLESDLIEARKRRDELALSTLGMLKSEIVKAGKEPGAHAATDDEAVIRAVRKEVKRRDEAARAFADAGRPEASANEESEAHLLRSYLPPEMTEAEIESVVRAVMAEVKPQGLRDLGVLMKAASPRLAGRVEAGRIAAVAKRLLA